MKLELVLPLLGLCFRSSVSEMWELRYFDFPSPETLSVEELRSDLKERKEIVREYGVREAVVSDALIPLYVDEGLDSKAIKRLLPLLEELKDFRDADFTIVMLVRIMFTTSRFDEMILPYLQDIPLWITKGEKLRIYWTENHMFMYTTSAYLLRQKFPQQFPALDDPTLDNRLLWLLRSKTENGFFEFNSHLYMEFTLSALLNLHDFSAKSEIKNLAHDCLTRFLTDWIDITNSYGVNSVASSRTYQFSYFTGERPSDESRTYGFPNQEAMSLITGLGPLVVRGPIEISTSFLLLSDFDLVPIAASFTQELYVTKSSGASYQDGVDFMFKNLSKEDRFIAQMSMGGYVGEDYILDFLEFAKIYDLWDHDVFSSSKFMSSFPNALVSTLATVISSVAGGSVLYVPEFKLYKNHDIMLSSLDNYFPGQKGYQQFAGNAVIGDASVFTQSLAASSWNTSAVKDQTKSNNQMPFLVQDHNLLISIYNPNLDLKLIGSPDLEVGLHFDYRNFDEIIDGREIDNVEDKWVFGRLDEGYVALYRHCFNDNFNISVCFDHKQVWITLVGNNYTHGSFAQFMHAIIENSVVNYSIERRCVSVKGFIDEKAFDERFCRDFGNAYVAVILVIFYIVFQASCCFECCRKKRRTWKKFVKKAKLAGSTSKPEGDLKEKDGSFTNKELEGEEGCKHATDETSHYTL